MNTIVCERCHIAAERTGSMQKYCAPCSEQRDLERKRRWARNHEPSEETRLNNLARATQAIELSREAGTETNGAHKSSILWKGDVRPDLLWQVIVSVPFSYAASKNHIFAMRRNGHIFLRKEARSKREEITLAVRQALAGRRIAHNKIWLDILVQKPNHRGDAVNIVDLVCDAIKVATVVDDKWFCIRRLDWEIAKENPRLFLAIGQDSPDDCQVCSFCGQVKTLESFPKKKSNPLGRDRVCRSCRASGRRLAKTQSVKEQSR